MKLGSGNVAELYRRLGPSIYSRCRRMLKDTAAAEDATQEIFIRVLKSAESRPPDDALLSWVHRITTNYCLNMLRDARRHAEPTAPEAMPEGRTEDFEDSVVTKDFAEQLLSRQPDDIKTPVMMYHVQGMEQTQVADAMGVSRRTVLYRLAEFAERARQFEALAEAGLA